jgi:hypothetical protein
MASLKLTEVGSAYVYIPCHDGSHVGIVDYLHLVYLELLASLTSQIPTCEAMVANELPLSTPFCASYNLILTPK